MALGLLAWALLLCHAGGAQAQFPPTSPAEQGAPTSGPLRLRQPVLSGQAAAGSVSAQPATAVVEAPPLALAADNSGDRPGEFELYIQNLVGTPGPTVPVIRRFGAELLTEAASMSASPDYGSLVPPSYMLQTGDELLVTLWGSVDADLRLQVDRSGRVVIPRVGPVMVAGVRYGDLPQVISTRVATVFKNFQLSVSLGQLRGMRVYVTGFVRRPGVQVVSSLSTLVQAVMKAGGPATAGSFRNIQLRRGRELVTTFDLYDLLLRGDRGADRLLQAEDVILVGPVGPQVGIIGSVNRVGVFELKPGETMDDALQMAGGFAPVADTSRLTIERLDERASVRVTEVLLPAGKTLALRSGDVLRAFNAVSVATPIQRQNKRVRIEGEVLNPGDYVLPAASTLNDAVRAAGGLTQSAFLYGAEFTRESVRSTQVQNYARALRDIETQVTRANVTQRITSSEENQAQIATLQRYNMLTDRLRTLQPTGRVVLEVASVAGQLPDLALEDGDRLHVPSRPTAVGVFGSVFNAGSYLFAPGRSVSDYLRLAGGPTRGADDRSIFVVRANGSVVSGLESSSFFNRQGALAGLVTEPGDTIFVPEELDKATFVQQAKDWTQIVYQFGLGAAGLKAAFR